MEAKDLILLLMIPVILIGLVLYSDRSSITGAQTAQIPQETTSTLIGTYKIMPSFKSSINYGMSKDYETLRETLGIITDSCKSSTDMEQCLKGKAEDYNWKCQDEAEETGILYDFADKLNECYNLEEDDVVCRFSLDERPILNLPNSFDIILTLENDATKVEVKRGEKSFSDYIDMKSLAYSEDYSTRDSSESNIDMVKYSIEFDGRKPVVRNAIAKKSEQTIVISSKFIFYKSNGYVKFIDATQEGNFRAGIPANKIVDLPLTKSFKFCAKSPSGTQVYAYDDSDKSTKLRDLVYKFSVVYPK